MSGGLKSYHHVKVDTEFKRDCEVWVSFLEGIPSLRETVARPFIDVTSPFQATTLEFFSDASLNFDLGFGARYEKEWTFGQWPQGFIAECKPSIKYAELLDCW